MKQIIFAIIILLSSNAIGQQGINNNWLIGYSSFGGIPFGNTKFNFFNGAPIITYDSIEMDFRHTHANISDSLGNMLFYSNGYYIANALDDTMDNGFGINPGAYANFAPDGFGIAQGALVIQKPNSNNIYYMFHGSVDDYPGTCCRAYHLYLTEIDMSLKNGLGSVVSKNYGVVNDILNTGKIAATKHGNGRDWWIMVHKENSNLFYKLLITPYGVQSVTTQNIGIKRFVDAGQAWFSPDGAKYGYFYINGGLEVFDFDRCSGDLSNPQHDSLAYEGGYNVGMAISPNSKYLYVSNMFHIYQYDISVTNMASSKTIVAEYDSFECIVLPWGGIPTVFGLAALAPDGKIYITTGNSTLNMHVIDQPDSPGIACNVIQHGVNLPAFYFNTLPNHPNYFLGDNGLCNNLGIPPAPYKGVKKITCFNNPTHDKFTLWFPVDKDVGVLEIYDVNGECIRREYVAQWSQYKTVDISNLSAGVYFCKMQWRSGEGSVRVVKIE